MDDKHEITEPDHKTGLELCKSIDPGARVLWDRQGPSDAKSRLVCILVKVAGERRTVISQEYPSGGFELFGEIAGTAEALDNVYRHAG